MRDPKRIFEITVLIYAIWKKSPNLRFGQLITNLISEYTKQTGTPVDVYNLEDSDFEKFLMEFNVWQKTKYGINACDVVESASG